MNIPFVTTKTAHSAIAPLLKIIEDLKAVADRQESIIENETIAINEARVRIQEATAEQVTAENFLKKIEELVA